MLTRIGVLMVLSGLVPLALVGLAAWNDPDALDDHVRAAIFSLVVLVGIHVGWAARDGHVGRLGSGGEMVWAAIGLVSPLGLLALMMIGLGWTNEWVAAIAMYVVASGSLALISMAAWLVGRALGGNSQA